MTPTRAQNRSAKRASPEELARAAEADWLGAPAETDIRKLHANQSANLGENREGGQQKRRKKEAFHAAIAPAEQSSNPAQQEFGVADRMAEELTDSQLMAELQVSTILSHLCRIIDVISAHRK